MFVLSKRLNQTVRLEIRDAQKLQPLIDKLPPLGEDFAPTPEQTRLIMLLAQIGRELVQSTISVKFLGLEGNSRPQVKLGFEVPDRVRIEYKQPA